MEVINTKGIEQPVDNTAKKLSAFSETRNLIVLYVVIINLEFNCYNTPALEVAQKMVDDNFSDIPGVLAVHDDIIVAGADGERHDTALKLVLDRAKERNIKFNRTKIQLRIDKVKYLGSIVSGEGFRPDPEKIKAIVDMPQPQNKQDLQHLLGMVNNLSQYIPNMSEITAPLHSLLKKQAQWSWYDEHDRSLAKIKEALTSSPVLRFFDVNKPATIQADACFRKGIL